MYEVCVHLTVTAVSMSLHTHLKSITIRLEWGIIIYMTSAIKFKFIFMVQIYTWKLISTQFICKLCACVCVFFRFTLLMYASFTFQEYNFLIEPRISNNKIHPKNRRKNKKKLKHFDMPVRWEGWSFHDILLNLYMCMVELNHWQMQNNRLPRWVINFRQN